MKTKYTVGLFRSQNTLSWIVYGLSAFLLMLLQMAPRCFPTVMNARPEPLVLLVVCVAMFEGPYFGAGIGVLAGLLWDLYSFRVFGLHAIILLGIGVVVGLLVQLILRANFISGMLLCVGGVICHALFEWLLCYALFMHNETWVVAGKVYAPNALYTILLAPVVYLLMLLVARFLRRRSKH